MKERKSLRKFFRLLLAEIHDNKKSFAVFLFLAAVIVAILVYSVLVGHWESVFTGVLALLLLLIPPFIEQTFKIKLPVTLEILAYLFVFASSILGEIGNYYQRFAFWDTMLHTFNGFMFAAFGFCLADVFNKGKQFRFRLSPLFLTLVAFCFSMTIGVMWEFLEYAFDAFLATDMQKDTILGAIHSVTLPSAAGGKVAHVRDIVSTTIVTASGETVVINGYLDVGLADTVKDLFVNFLGAIVFSVIGYFYVKHRGKSKIARQFIPIFVGDKDDGEEPKT